jgi:hypothetical protein
MVHFDDQATFTAAHSLVFIESEVLGFVFVCFFNR